MAKIHYHICSCGKWKCNHEKDCNLSQHASCGQKVAHNYSFCVQGKNFGPAIAKPEKNKIKKMPETAPKKSQKMLKKAA